MCSVGGAVSLLREPQTKGLGSFVDPRAWYKEGRVRSGKVLSPESEWGKVPFQFSNSLIRRLPNGGTCARNAGVQEQGWPGRAASPT